MTPKLYKIKVTTPKTIALHYPTHEVIVNNIIEELSKSITLRDVPQNQVDELFKAGVVLSAEEEIKDDT